MSNPHFADLSPEDCPADIPKSKGNAVLAGAWSYPAVGNTPPLLKVRYDRPGAEKDMLWYRAAAGDCWEPGLDGHAPGLYGIGSIQHGQPVIVCEGEKSAGALHSLGIPAVGLPGAGSAASVDLSPLDGLDVVAWPDHDKPGADAMDTIGTRLARAHRRIDPAALDLGPKQDAADAVGWHFLDGAGLWAWLNDALSDVAGPVPPEPMGQHLPDDWFTMDLPPREFVFQGVLPLDAVSLLVATGGSGKSMLALQLAASVATGRTLLDTFSPTAGPSRVAVLALEDDRREIHARLKRIAAAFRLDYDSSDLVAVAKHLRLYNLPTFAVASGDPRTGMLTTSSDLKQLSADLAEFGPRLVIADPLAGLLGGVVEEGSNEAAQAIIGMLRDALPSRCALLVCAHTSKAERMVSTTARGASAWMDAARQVIALRPPEAEEARALGKDDAAHTAVLAMTKSNYSALAPPVYLQRCTRPEFAGVLKPFDFADRKRQTARARTESIAGAVLTALTEYPVTLNEAWPKGNEEARERGNSFIEAVNVHAGRDVTRTDRLACLNALLSDGRVVRWKDGKREVLSCAPHTEDECL